MFQHSHSLSLVLGSTVVIGIVALVVLVSYTSRGGQSVFARRRGDRATILRRESDIRESMATGDKEARKRPAYSSPRNLFGDDWLAVAGNTEAIDQSIWLTQVFGLRREGALTSAGTLDVLKGYVRAAVSTDHDDHILRFLRVSRGLGYIDEVAGRQALEFSARILYRYNRSTKRDQDFIVELELGKFLHEAGV